MNLTETVRFLRESAATFVIILAIVVGVGHWIVVPQGRTWKETAARVHVLAAEDTQSLNVASITSRASEIRDRIRRIEATSQLSADSARLYELLLSLGAKAGIEMGRIIPDSNLTETELTRGYSFQVAANGPHASVIEFVRLMSQERVFSRIEKLDIDPRTSEQGDPITAMTMRIQFLQFKIAPPLQELARGDS